MTRVAATLSHNPRVPRRRLATWHLVGLALLLPVLLLLLVGFALPLWSVLVRSLDSGFDTYWSLAESEVFRTVLGRTFSTAGLVCLVCLILGYPYAYLMTVASRRWRDLMVIAILVPLWTSVIVRNFALVILLQNNGLINEALVAMGFGRVELIRNTFAVVVGMAQVMIPFAVLPMYAVMQKIDRRLLQAAAACGARPSVAFARIFVPLSLPGVVAAVTLVFVISLGFFLTPQLLGSPSNALISQLMFTQLRGLGDLGSGAAMGFILLLATLILMALAAVVTRKLRRAR